MNRKLLAIAVGAAVVFPGMALAEGPKVYGKVNVSLEQYEGDLSAFLDGATFDDAEAIDSQWQLASNASRIGVKGEFDLDVADMKAIYQLEYETFVDDGRKDSSGGVDETFTQRNTFAGLKGGFGALKAGKFDTPTKVAQGDVDQFNDLDADIKHIMAGENRASNIIQYSSPTLADSITLNAAFIPAEGKDLDGDLKAEDGLADSTSLSVIFEQGGIYAALAMDQDMEDELLTDSTGTSDTIDITRLVGGYAMDAFEIGALYQMAEETEGDGEENSLLVSGAYKIDRVKLKAQFGKTTAEGTDGNETEATLIALGADYKLAKASKAYVYYANVEGDDGSDSLEDTTVGVGLEHKF